jgi:predicted transcriptional regulator
MNITDFAVTRAIDELQNRKKQSLEDIAAYIGCERKTVHRSIKRLVESGEIVAIGNGGRDSYHYERVTDDYRSVS